MTPTNNVLGSDSRSTLQKFNQLLLSDHVNGLGASGIIHDRKLYPVALVEVSEAIIRNSRIVYKHLFYAFCFRLDEPISLGTIKPLYCAGYSLGQNDTSPLVRMYNETGTKKRCSPLNVLLHQKANRNSVKISSVGVS
jgi:hypothetical protein